MLNLCAQTYAQDWIHKAMFSRSHLSDCYRKLLAVFRMSVPWVGIFILSEEGNETDGNSSLCGLLLTVSLLCLRFSCMIFGPTSHCSSRTTSTDCPSSQCTSRRQWIWSCLPTLGLSKCGTRIQYVFLVEIAFFITHMLPLLLPLLSYVGAFRKRQPASNWDIVSYLRLTGHFLPVKKFWFAETGMHCRCFLSENHCLRVLLFPSFNSKCHFKVW